VVHIWEIQRALWVSEGQVECKINAPLDSERTVRISGFPDSRTDSMILLGFGNATAAVEGVTKLHTMVDEVTPALRIVGRDVPMGRPAPKS
jgi:hypothetical protein